MEHFPIHDLFVKALEKHDAGDLTRLPVLSFDDHILRQFGFVEAIWLSPNFMTDMVLREIADEVWALITGQVTFTWHDLRSTSPTFGSSFQLTCEEPTLVLVPFGVEFSQRTNSEPAFLLRFSTHPENDSEYPQSKNRSVT
ncbi:MAG: hypothetical protein GTO18_01005 [Anaerolineales bacterium]|nr:hypothetical protein [Anaerolineales bacterium]